ncbi:arabinogalactan endo-1,4-beta-galactosidase [Phaeosphaeria sp. MPI-PUGE-AT-0046c]|nr:arabinogalactan endo-1,4-beta-galactosidase [Phaeosphaeria sp. MPI-PUGE-AT-0046c]
MRPATRFSSALLRRAIRTPLRAQSPANAVVTRAAAMPGNTAAAAARPFHTSVALRSIMPDAENPAPKKSEDHDQPSAPAELSTEEFHERADAYLNELVEKLEQAQEKDPQIEVEYAAGVLEVKVKDNSYVLNKQPPNRQIWLSSPLSGPKRFDWVVAQEGLNAKEGSGQGDWVYLRDGSSLTDIVKKELDVNVGVEDEGPI